MNDSCIFCKIVAGGIPSTKVYEDSDVLAFMDISPVTKGHTLVIPKAHHDPITRMPLPLLQRVISVVQRIAQAHVSGLKADGINITQANGEIAGQIVPHVHFHIVPRYKGDTHSWTAPQKKYDTDAESQQFADAIKKALSK